MIGVVVLFLLSSFRAQNVWAGNELPKDTSVRTSKSIYSNLASILNLLGEQYVDEKEGLNFLSRWVFPKKNDVCLTQGCFEAARGVLENMNTNADPCDNFYEFACGNFIKKTKIPYGQSEVTLFTITEDKVTDQLKVILNETATDEARPFRMAKDFYKSCMNESNIKEPDLSYIKEIVQRMGGWPVLEGDRWDASKFTWQDTVYKFKDEGFSIDYLISFTIMPDMKNNTNFAIQLDQAIPGIEREFLVRGMEGETVQNYYRYMVDIAVLLGADRNRAAKELKESLDFETQLAIISTPKENRRNYYSLYNPLTILQLQERFPSIPWSEYISNILPKSIKFEPEEVVFVKDIPYIKKLENLLATTPKRTLANYMMWRAVNSVIPYFMTWIQGPHWRYCARKAAEGVYMAVGSLYVERFFELETKRKALEMVNDIREELYKTLQTVDWMDKETRRNALEKAQAMVAHIAYPDEILDVSKLEDIYHKYEITQEKYLAARLNWTKFELDVMLSWLRKPPINKNEWVLHTNVIKVGASYSAFYNNIEIPAGILQGVYFSYERPNYMNYGALGYAIGHELIHGFDDQGREFDKNGNLNDWWDPETRKTFLRKAACIIDQYRNYRVEQVGMNLTEVTPGENIADNGGIKLAYRAYNRWVEKHGTEKRLPGLRDFTPKQMFWISAANIWCSKYSPEALAQKIVSGVHSPGEFRVQGPFSNRPEFANDFKCPLGSKMNPYKKCRLW